MLPMSSVDTGATDRWSRSAPSRSTPLFDEESTPRLTSKPLAQSNPLADVESYNTSTEYPRRKTSRKAVPPGGHLSTGNRASLHRRTSSISMKSENIPDKSSKSLLKSTDQLTSHPNASISRKKVNNETKSPSDRALTAEEQSAHGLTDLCSGINIPPNPIMSYEVLYTTPVVVPSIALTMDYSRKDIGSATTGALPLRSDACRASNDGNIKTRHSKNFRRSRRTN